MSTNWNKGVTKYGFLDDVLVKSFSVLVQISLREWEIVLNHELEGLGLEKLANVCNCDVGIFRQELIAFTYTE